MSTFKVQPASDSGLCGTCREGKVTEDIRGKTFIVCNHGMRPNIVMVPLVRCTEYDDRRVPWKHDLEKVAWVLNSDKSGKILGFAPPKRKKEDDD